MFMKLLSFYTFEQSMRFSPLALNFVMALRPYVQRVLMLLIFLRAVRTFVKRRNDYAPEDVGYFDAFQDIYVSILVVFLSISLLYFATYILEKRSQRYIARMVQRREQHSKLGNGKPPPPEALFGSRKNYNGFSRCVLSVLITIVIMLLFEAQVALPFFFAAILFNLVAHRQIGAMRSLGGARRLFLRTSGMEFATLCVYVLSLCSYFYFFGAPNLGLIGLFVIIMVPRIAFNATRKYLIQG
jgi:hypothetical protein